MKLLGGLAAAVGIVHVLAHATLPTAILFHGILIVGGVIAALWRK